MQTTAIVQASLSSYNDALFMDAVEGVLLGGFFEVVVQGRLGSHPSELVQACRHPLVQKLQPVSAHLPPRRAH